MTKQALFQTGTPPLHSAGGHESCEPEERPAIKPGIIQRAYELAHVGDYATVTEIKRRLRAEGYAGAEAYLQGGALLSALRKICAQARANRAAETPIHQP